MKYIFYFLLLAVIPIFFLVVLKFIPKPNYDVKTIERGVDKIKSLIVTEENKN